MVIHTVGDSHSYMGWKGLKNIICHHIGPVLCFSVGRDGLKRLDIRNYQLQNNDTIIFCFGEIDCRCHIHKYVNFTNPYENIINELVDKYFNTIKLNIELIKLNLKVCVYNVPPPIRWRPETHEFPYLGTDEERKQYHLYFNNRLKQKCQEYNYIFFDVYDKYVDDHGFLIKKLSDNNCHINDGVYLQEFIDNMHNLYNNKY